jgi:lipoic acid synthetase
MRFVEPKEFEDYAKTARAKGFLMVAATPLTRSSHHADRDFEELKKKRAGQGKS